MDLITQAVFGGVVGQAGFRHTLGRRAVAAGLLIGMIPDFDVIANLFGPWNGLKYHRAETHSVFVLPFLSIFVGWLLWRVTHRQNRLRTWIHLAFWALITHPVLDLFTAYGTQVLAPFSRRPFAIDALAIIDLFYTLPLLLILLPGLSKRIGNRSARLMAFGAILITTLYAIAGYNMSQQIVRTGRQRLESAGFPVEEIRAMPTLLNNVLFRVVARGPDRRFKITYVSARHIDHPWQWVDRHKEADPRIAKAWEAPHAQLFARFAMGFGMGTVRPETGDVEFEDLRYGFIGDPGQGMFRARAHFAPDGSVSSVDRIRPASPDVRGELGRMWQFIRRGPQPPHSSDRNREGCLHP